MAHRSNPPVSRWVAWSTHGYRLRAMGVSPMFLVGGETFGPTGRQYQGSLINWGRLDWGPYDTPQMSLPAGQVYYNFATENVVNGPRP